MDDSAAPMRLLFVTVAGNEIGLGHQNRCLSIAAAAGSEALISFIVFGDALAAARMEESGYSYRMRPLSDLSRISMESFRDVTGPFDTIVADILYSGFFGSEDPQAVFQAMRTLTGLVAAVDSLGEHSLASQLPAVPVDVLIVPYVVSDVDRSRIGGVGRRQLHGPAYALLSPEYSDLHPRTHRTDANRVLLTCGGSDPKHWTPAILRGFESIATDLKVRVIVGPLFDHDMRLEVAQMAAESKHKVALIDAPDSLLEHMIWCDLAVAASGLTKYELAAASTPTVLFSIDCLHDSANKPFAAVRSVLDLGAAATPEQIARETSQLLADHQRRTAMAAAGRKLVDGLGAKRLFTELERELSCSVVN